MDKVLANTKRYNVELTGYEMDLLWDVIGMLIDNPMWEKAKDVLLELRNKVNQDVQMY